VFGFAHFLDEYCQVTHATGESGFAGHRQCTIKRQCSWRQKQQKAVSGKNLSEKDTAGAYFAPPGHICWISGSLNTSQNPISVLCLVLILQFAEIMPMVFCCMRVSVRDFEILMFSKLVMSVNLLDMSLLLL